MKCPYCGHEPKARKVKVQPAEKSTAEMSTAELYEFYKRTSHIEDVRFFSAMLARAGLGPLANQAIVLLVEAEHGLPRAEVLRRLIRLQESWRTRDQPAADEGRFWRHCRQLGARQRGKEYRDMRDRLLPRIKNLARGLDYRGAYTHTHDWDDDQRYVISDVVRLAHAARELCPSIATEAA